MIDNPSIVILENRRADDPEISSFLRNFDQVPKRIRIDNGIIIEQPHEVTSLFGRNSNSEITASCETQVFAGSNNGNTVKTVADSTIERNIGSVVDDKHVKTIVTKL